MTRSIGNGTYIMLAYQGGILKGEVEGTITGGTFTPNVGGNKAISLSPGNYDFVLYRSGDFTRSGNNLTITNPSEYVMLGRVNNYTITATPNKQQVPFVMRHAVSRVRVRVTGYKDGGFYGGESIGYLSLSVPNSTENPTTAIYNAANGSWSGSGAKSNIGPFPFYSSSWTKVEDEVGFRLTSPNYAYLMPGANITKVNAVAPFGPSSLNIYGENLTGKNLTITLRPVLKTEPNGSYLINITLRKNFLYLMSDGTTGLLSETIYGGGTKVPIGVVVSQSKKLAAALDIVMPNYTPSTTPPASNSGINDHYVDYPELGTDTDVPNDDGYKYTWEGAGSADGVTIKGNIDGYSHFYAAAQYSPTLPAGKTLSGSIVGKKWFLPSLTDVLMYKGGPAINNIKLNINYGGGGSDGTLPLYDRPQIKTSGFSLNYNTFDLAFIQVGGKKQGRRAFYTSTLMYRTGSVSKDYIITDGGWVYNYDSFFGYSYHIRPFIKY